MIGGWNGTGAATGAGGGTGGLRINGSMRSQFVLDYLKPRGGRRGLFLASNTGSLYVSLGALHCAMGG